MQPLEIPTRRLVVVLLPFYTAVPPLLCASSSASSRLLPQQASDPIPPLLYIHLRALLCPVSHFICEHHPILSSQSVPNAEGARVASEKIFIGSASLSTALQRLSSLSTPSSAFESRSPRHGVIDQTSLPSIFACSFNPLETTTFRE